MLVAMQVVAMVDDHCGRDAGDGGDDDGVKSNLTKFGEIRPVQEYYIALYCIILYYII